MVTNSDFSKPLVDLKLSNSRKIIVAERSNGDYWFNEWVSGSSFTGFTSKGFGVGRTMSEDFLNALRAVASSKGSQEIRLPLGDSKELVVWQPAPNQVDIRQWINSEKYTGFTKKGIRLISSNALKLIDAFSKAITSETFEAEKNEGGLMHKVEACLSCGTKKRPIYKEGLCEICYTRENSRYTTRHEKYNEEAEPRNDEGQVDAHRVNPIALHKAFSIHGKKCYICQTPYNSARKNLLVYFADGNKANLTDSNIYPVCHACRMTIPGA